jgi:maltose O-acetyltransferase
MKFLKAFLWPFKLVFFILPGWLFRNMVKNWPAEMKGNAIRKWYYKRRFHAFGDKTQILEGCEIYGHELISIGYHSSIGRFCELNAGPGPKPCLIIGDHAWLGPYSFFRTVNHRFDDPDVLFIKQGHGDERVIRIGNDVYGGAHCLYLAGTEVGDHCVIAAGSVLSGKYPAYSVIGGNPARVIKKRKTVPDA